MQADQHRVGLQLQGVGDVVEAGREIDHAVGVDRLLDGGGVVGGVVALGAQRADIDQSAVGGRAGSRARGLGQSAQRLGLDGRPVLAHLAQARARSGRG
jgi:hypothetical protein